MRGPLPNPADRSRCVARPDDVEQFAGRRAGDLGGRNCAREFIRA
ncbi:hypothetical protein Rumeso_02620 [Rubellimicrobium mesophilum DSM 19309]|uniref:Uncharacterized protein n=1 Tax=Rubellimicrobium mesophilum DSM 19309 TaxID=442562 RepID=A0A017HNU1_9RHOB|nr:hypothetical protein Rumeso_02620 [Rubellimicrobium mesophilum DSM 19309]